MIRKDVRKRATGVILNPKSGGGRADIRQELRAWADSHSEPIHIHTTNGNEDLRPVLEDMRQADTGRVLVAGGDGTVSRVASALLDQELPLGILPIGTANGVARQLGIPLKVEAALELLREGHEVRRLDAIYCNDRVFLISLSVGVSAQSMEWTGAGDKARYGLFAYYLKGAKSAFDFVPQPITLDLGCSRIRDVFMEVAVLNMGITGLPEALLGGRISPDDGSLRLVTLGGGSIPERTVQSLKGNPEGLESWIQARDITEVDIHGASTMVVQGDGDIIGRLPIRVKILPRRIPVIVPAGSTIGH